MTFRVKQTVLVDDNVCVIRRISDRSICVIRKGSGQSICIKIEDVEEKIKPYSDPYGCDTPIGPQHYDSSKRFFNPK